MKKTLYDQVACRIVECKSCLSIVTPEELWDDGSCKVCNPNYMRNVVRRTMKTIRMTPEVLSLVNHIRR